MKVIGNLEIVGYATIDFFIRLRNEAKTLNKIGNKQYVYSVIRNPKGQKYGYYLIREKIK